MTKIAELNDRLRQNIFCPGKNKVVITSGVATLLLVDRMDLFKKISEFNNFNKSNDPYQEHDFGRIEHNGINYFFKIDYYDTSMEYGSNDPSNPDITTRVLTIMRADEY
ncbi:MAG: DUF3768 domain-containing protein [Alphaproteobacteria bacterium]|nr:DUF3768 domain-containing protein [Alphaproteobacteria bacterium]